MALEVTQQCLSQRLESGGKCRTPFPDEVTPAVQRLSLQRLREIADWQSYSSSGQAPRITVLPSTSPPAPKCPALFITIFALAAPAVRSFAVYQTLRIHSHSTLAITFVRLVRPRFKDEIAEAQRA